MTRSHGNNKQWIVQGLNIFQVNDKKCSTAHDTAFELATHSGANLILIQEPWIFSETTHTFTKTQPKCNALAPLPEWSDRPTVITCT